MPPFANAHIFQPPQAKRLTVDRRLNGIDIPDDYGWIRAENWREALLDPTKLPADIRKLLEAENAYADQVLADLAPLADAILEELSGRIDETDSEPPARDGAFLYYRRYREEGEHELVCRRPAAGGKSSDQSCGDESILLDGDLEAEGKAYFDLGETLHSPDHRWLAWSCDDNGDELHTIRVRDLGLGTDGADEVKNTDGAIVWTRDSRAFLYTRMDADFRTAEVYLHEIGADPASDRLVFEERDPAWFVWLRASRSRGHAIITVSDHDCSECWLVDLASPTDVRRSCPDERGCATTSNRETTAFTCAPTPMAPLISSCFPRLSTRGTHRSGARRRRTSPAG